MAPTIPRAKKVNTDKPSSKKGILPSKISKRRKTPSTASNQTSLMTLPAELRNAIYEEVLIEGNNLDLGLFTQRRKRGEAMATPQKRYARSEPELLQVSKQIRAETLNMYYLRNSFDIEVRLVDFGDLAAWLRKVVQRCGAKFFDNLRIQIICPSWSTFHHILPLARMFYRTGWRAGQRWNSSSTFGEITHWRLPSYKQSQQLPGWFRAGEGYGFGKVVRPGSFIPDAINNVMQIGQQAAREGWSGGRFEKRLAVFLREVYSDRVVLRSIQKGLPGPREDRKKWFLASRLARLEKNKMVYVKDLPGTLAWPESIINQVCGSSSED